jgi:hypothetical protein
MKYYCYKCGKGNTFFSKRPDVCSFCKTIFSSVLEKNKPVLPNTLAYKDNLYKEDSIEVSQFVNFKRVKPSFTFQADISKSNHTLGDLINANENSDYFDENNEGTDSIKIKTEQYISDSPRSSNEILEAFKNEAGCSRNK